MKHSGRKKDVAFPKATRGPKTKNSNLLPKKIPESLPGYVEARLIKCGKSHCKCKRGQLHGAYFYHITWDGSRHRKRYVRLADVPATVVACQRYRDEQAILRIGRALYKLLLARAKELSS